MREAAESTLCIGGARLTFVGCQSNALPPAFAAFAVEDTAPSHARFTVTTGACAKSTQAPLAATDVWRLADCGERLHFSAGAALADRPMLSAELAPDWSSGTLCIDPAAPALTRLAPVTSHFGELAALVHLNAHGACYVHAAAVEWQRQAYVLLGASGAGKSTLACLAEAHGATVLSDDRTVLRIEDEQVFAYGTPFHGTAARWAARRVPVRGLYFLAHGPRTEEHELPRREAIGRLVSLCFTPFWSKSAVEAAVGNAAELSRLVASSSFVFVPEPAAASTLLERR